MASTVKDLEYLRDRIYEYLKDEGYKVWMNEKPGFPTNLDPDAMTNCIRAAEKCDYFILLLDKRAGLHYKDTGMTITEAEYQAARKKGKSMSIFVRQAVDSQCAVYRQLEKRDRQRRRWYADPEVFEFYNRLMHERSVPWIHKFDSFDDIHRCLESELPSPENKADIHRRRTPRKMVGYDLRRYRSLCDLVTVNRNTPLIFVYGHGRHRPEADENQQEHARREVEAQIWTAVEPLIQRIDYRAGHKRIRSPDLDLAFSLAAKIGWELGQSTRKERERDDWPRIRGVTDLYLENSRDMKRDANILSIGAGDTNLFTAHVLRKYDRQLMIRFNAPQDSQHIESLVEGRREYERETYGMVSFLKNPLNSSRVVILAAGVGSVGTSAALLALLREKDNSRESISLWSGNIHDKRCSQRVVEATECDELTVRGVKVEVVKKFEFRE